MLVLGQDIIEHNLSPLLNFEDILSLRCVCKYLYDIIETSEGWKWDRRYYEDFPYDARRLDGNGFERYSRRCRARIVLDPGCNSSGSDILLGDPAFLESIASEPIVDIISFWSQEFCPQEFGSGILVRRLDNSLEAYTSDNVISVLDTKDVSRLHCLDFQREYSHCGACEFDLVPEIWGWKDGELVKYRLDDLFFYNPRKKEEALSMALEEQKPIALEPSPVLLTCRDLYLFTEWDTWPDACVPRRLGEPPSSLKYYYTRLNYEMEKRFTSRRDCYGDLVANLLKEFPVRLDIVTPSAMQRHSYDVHPYFQPFAVAASAGCNIFVLGRGHEKHAFTLPHKIVTLIADDCLCALDEKGNVYVGSLYMKDELVVSEPKLVLKNALQLVGGSALMSDGTVKCVYVSSDDSPVAVCVEADGSPGRDIGVENAVLTDGEVSLVVY